MPNVAVLNETPGPLNIAFRFVAPASWTNTLEPGQTWNCDQGSFWFTIEVRRDLGHNRFSPEHSWQIAGNILGAWGAGAASVLFGTAGAVGIAPAAPAFMGASALMNHAVAG